VSLAHVISDRGAVEDAPQVQDLGSQNPVAPSLTSRLVERLSELRERGYTILWIALPADQITSLFVEGGDDAILLDEDPARDAAWFRGDEIRPSIDDGAWIYVEGQFAEMSRLQV